MTISAALANFTLISSHHRETLVLLALLAKLAKMDQREPVVTPDSQEDRETLDFVELLVHLERKENPERMDLL